LYPRQIASTALRWSHWRQRGTPGLEFRLTDAEQILDLPRAEYLAHREIDVVERGLPQVLAPVQARAAHRGPAAVRRLDERPARLDRPGAEQSSETVESRVPSEVAIPEE
jgi:hypothetical protein